MRSADFNVCHPRARMLAERLYNSGRSPQLCFGAYNPTSDINTWDERWQGLVKHMPWNYKKGFLHFWVECERMIWDCSLQQFGMSLDVGIYQLNDPRYKKIGVEDIQTREVVIVSKALVVDWNAFPEFSLKNGKFGGF